MISRNRTALIFAAFGAFAAVGMFLMAGDGDVPTEALAMIPIFVFSAGLTGWLFAHKLATPFRAFAILTGAVVMLGAQIPFALITASLFWFREPISLMEYGKSISVLIVGGLAVAGIFQTVAGGLAGWLVHRLSGHYEE